MLEFFRRYQKFLFIVITAAVVISFSFFGTYSLFTTQETKDREVFVAVDGSKVYSSELQDLIRLLSYEESPFQDDVVEKDILSTPIATSLVDSYLGEMKEDLISRHEKEKRFVPYVHPQANYLSAEQVWTYFAPDLKKNYDELKSLNSAATPAAFQTRVKLYLAQKRFPADYLKYFLRYQEMQHSELSEDHDLQRRDMALFGYHSIQDWFGPKFTMLTAKFIINSARVASMKGMKVGGKEALKSIMENVHANFKEQIRRNQEGMIYDNFNDYFQAELRKLGMDQSRLVKAWEDVLLFRRLFNETAESILVSDLPYKDFYQYLSEYVDVELYRLPKELDAKTDREQARLEIYLQAVREPKTKNSPLFSMKLKEVSEIQKVYPELVQKRYRLQYAVCTKDQLSAKSTLRSTWSWETQEDNFKKLADKFPELGAKNAGKQVAGDQAAREQSLDQLDSKTRTLVDAYARTLIVEEHPEWLHETLEKAPLREATVYMREQGGKMPFQGIQRRKELMQIMDSVPLNSQNPALFGYTQDKNHFYRIVIIDRSEKPELMTLKEALGDGTLDQLLDKTLEASYPRLRQQKPSSYIQENGEFKPFQEVKEQLIESNFQDLFQKLASEAAELKARIPEYCNWADKEEARAAVRFYGTLEAARKKVEANPESVNELVFDKEKAKNSPLTEQFKLIQIKERVLRGTENPPLNVTVAFITAPKALSITNFSPKSGPLFFRVLERGALRSDEAIFEKVFEAKSILGQELKGEYARVLVREMQKKKALSLQE